MNTNTNKLLIPSTKRLRQIGVLLLVLAFLFYFESHPLWVEQYYTQGIYKNAIAPFGRLLFGWVPFAIGDLLYAAAIIWFLVRVFKFFKNKKWKGYSATFFVRLANFVFWFCSFYIGFKLLWGFNYSRPGIAYQLQITPKAYSNQDLKEVIDFHFKKIKQIDSIVLKEAHNKNFDFYNKELQAIYDTAATTYSYLKYNYKSMKKSLQGKIASYMGYYGYFNPFSHEGNLNVHIPNFLNPFVITHETAHQLGYASESEANFVAYLVCMRSHKPNYEFSAGFEVLHHAIAELVYRDSTQIKAIKDSMPIAYKTAFKNLIDYQKDYNGVLSNISLWIYDKYLKSNKQSSGRNSYSEILGWLIAYKKKYGFYPN
jgi:hypothetical protein